MEATKDTNGKTSGKRVGGFVLIGAGVAVAILGVVLDRATTSSILWPLVISGAGLLGVTVLEKPKI